MVAKTVTYYAVILFYDIYTIFGHSHNDQKPKSPVKRTWLIREVTGVSEIVHGYNGLS